MDSGDKPDGREREASGIRGSEENYHQHDRGGESRTYSRLFLTPPPYPIHGQKGSLIVVQITFINCLQVLHRYFDDV